MEQEYKPPVFYDVSLDEFRVATQDDVNKMVAIVQAFGCIRECHLRANAHMEDLRRLFKDKFGIEWVR